MVARCRGRRRVALCGLLVRRLVGGAFSTHPLGRLILPGLGSPVAFFFLGGGRGLRHIAIASLRKGAHEVEDDLDMRARKVGKGGGCLVDRFGDAEDVGPVPRLIGPLLYLPAGVEAEQDLQGLLQRLDAQQGRLKRHPRGGFHERRVRQQDRLLGLRKRLGDTRHHLGCGRYRFGELPDFVDLK